MMIGVIWRTLLGRLPELGSVWLHRDTGSRYEVCAVEAEQRRIWTRLYAGGIVKQPRSCCGLLAFHASFIPAVSLGRVDRLELRPGDTVVLFLPPDIDDAGAARLERHVAARCPEHVLVVMPAGGLLAAMGMGGGHTIGIPPMTGGRAASRAARAIQQEHEAWTSRS